MAASKPARDRKRLLAQYGRLYKRHMVDSPPCCFYCGDKFEVLDHCPPLNALDYGGGEGMRRRKIPLALIPACNQCNHALGHRELLTVAERLDYLEKRYTAEAERIKGLWSEDELSELGDGLRNWIKQAHRNQIDLIRRVDNIQRRIIRNWTHPVFDNELLTDAA